jgi:hypothetical protein
METHYGRTIGLGAVPQPTTTNKKTSVPNAHTTMPNLRKAPKPKIVKKSLAPRATSGLKKAKLNAKIS